MQMTREQHLQWAKQRALEYADRGEMVNAFASLGSDLNKHDGTRNHAGIKIGMQLAAQLAAVSGHDAPLR